MKRHFSTELAYITGMVLLAIGTALMEKADFGMSAIVAPAYILHLKISKILPWFTFGVSEYVFQVFLLFLLCLTVRKMKKGYLFSFVTAVFYGFLLDVSIRLCTIISADTLAVRTVLFLGGLVICGAGVAFLFHTYIAPEVYELFVKEVAETYSLPMANVKTAYDCGSFAAAIALSFLFFGFGHFVGVKAGTVFCTLVNGRLIGMLSRYLDSTFEFQDSLALRGIFER